MKTWKRYAKSTGCALRTISHSPARSFLCQIHSAKSITRVGEGLGRILGFVIARIENPVFAHVLTLDVVPEARRCGIGISLMRAMHRVLAKEKIRTAVLEVSARNLPAQRLYEKLQYRYVETVYGYYQGREDAYRMVRTCRR